MTMRVASWLAALALLAWAGLAQADQPKSVFDNGVDAPTITLQGDGDADTELVHGWRGGYGGGWRGGYGGYGGGWGVGYRGWGGGYGGYYGGYRGWGGYGGGWGHGYYNRPYVNLSFGYYPRYYSSYHYRPWSYGYSSYYSPSYYGIGYSSYYYQPYYGGYYCINGTESDATVQATPLGQLPNVPSMPPADQQEQQPFQYDGGPNSPVPLPSDSTQPQKNNQPAPQAPLKGHLVSIPGSPQSSGFAFPAYGSEAQIPAAPAAPATSGFAFPAYGEQPQSSGFATKQ